MSATPNNPPDTTGYGSVPYAYQMGKYDVTVGQYCQFLNAVAKTDTYRLYNGLMGLVYPGTGIAQSGSTGNFTYAVTGTSPNKNDFPISDESWGDAARFCNWLQNGQPSGSEGAGTTETGAYTLNGGTTDAALLAVARNPTASYFVPTENEWYKAAYYDPTLTGGAGGYWRYATKSNTAPSNVLSATGTNNANYFVNSYTDPINYLTPVGYFVLSPGPYGTYDMGGDVDQWTETVGGISTLFVSGGDWYYHYLGYSSTQYPSSGNGLEGFRVVAAEPVPEPTSIALLLAGGLGLLAYAWRRRRQEA